MFDVFASFAMSRRKSGVGRRTSEVLDALPAEIQKDIGWKWSPRLRGNAIQPGRLDFDLL